MMPEDPAKPELPGEASSDVESRLQHLELQVRLLLDAGLDRRLAALEQKCHALSAPAKPQGAEEPMDGTPDAGEDPEARRNMPLQNESLGAPAPDNPPQPLPMGSSERRRPQFEEEDRWAAMAPQAKGVKIGHSSLEAKEALEVYHGRASVMHRVELGIDEKILDTQTKEYYQFGESTWDLVIFIGTGALGPVGSCQTLVLLVMNVLMQGIFVGIAWFNFLVPDVDETTIVDAFRWRESSAHSLSEYDEVSRSSLAERVCSGDKSLHLSGVQMALYEDIKKYLKPDETGISSHFTGQVLCMVALVCWYLMVAKEVSHALALHRGIAAVPRGPNKLEPRENPFTQVTHYRLTYITNRRKFASAMLLAYRLLAAALLIYVGTYFLVYTVNVTELILNAVALEIILDIDDLIFDALATTPGRHLVHHLEPLAMPSFPRWRGADSKSLTMSLLIPLICVLVYFLMLAPMVETLQSVSNEMCGGNLKFVWGLDKRNITLFAATSGGGWDEFSETIQTRAIQEAQNLGSGADPGNKTQYGVWLSSVTTLLDMSELDLETIVDQSNGQCGDLATSGPMLSYLRDGLQNQSISGCADAISFCTSVSKMPEWGIDGGRGFLTRMLCSETCGCGNPGGDFLLVQGCPYGKKRPCQSSAQFLSVLQEAPCTERTARELRSFGPWVRWIDALKTFAETEGNLQGTAEAKLLAQAMWDHGCAFGANMTAQNVTWGDCFEWGPTFDWDFKTLDFFCPVTCECGSLHKDSACPTPQGRQCDELSDCVLYAGWYYCRGEVEVVDAVIQLQIDDIATAAQHVTALEQALRETVAAVLGTDVPVEAVQFEDFLTPPGVGPGRRLLQANFDVNIYLLSPDMGKAQVEQRISTSDADQMSQMLTAKLDGLPVDVSTIGVSISTFMLFGSRSS